MFPISLNVLKLHCWIFNWLVKTLNPLSCYNSLPNFVDVALKLLLHHKKELALATDKNALHVLARNPSVFDRTRQPIFWRLLNKSKLSAGKCTIFCCPDDACKIFSI